jgi:hypothetical protein
MFWQDNGTNATWFCGTGPISLRPVPPACPRRQAKVGDINGDGVLHAPVEPTQVGCHPAYAPPAAVTSATFLGRLERAVLSYG